MKPAVLLLVVFTLMFTSGCGVYSKEPILNDNQLIKDPSLLGRWVTEDGENSFAVRATANPDAYEIVAVDANNKEETCPFRIGKIGDLEILEFRYDAGNNPGDPIHSGKYSFFVVITQSAPRVMASEMNVGWLERYLADHPEELKTEGLQKPPPPNTNPNAPREMTLPHGVLITSPTADVQAFILRHFKDPEAFPPVTVVGVRPGDPTTKPTTNPTTAP